MSGVNVLAVILRHADSCRSSSDTDAYSAQEAPRLEAAYSAIADLIDAASEYRKQYGWKGSSLQERSALKLDAALSRVRGAE